MNSAEFRGVLPIADAPIEIIKTGQLRAAGNRAAIYASDGGAAIDQTTYTADPAGAFRFYCEDRVDIYYGPGPSPVWSDVLVGDLSSPATVTDLGPLGAAVTLDMLNRAEYHAKGTLGADDTTFSLSNVPAGVIAVMLDIAVGVTLGNLTFTGATPAPTLEVNKNYRLLWTRDQLSGLFSLDIKGLV